MAKVIIDSWGNKTYYNDHGAVHRTDGGPASISTNGTIIWRAYGAPLLNHNYYSDKAPCGFIRRFNKFFKLHSVRSKYPSFDNPNGYKEWHNDGERIWPELK